MIGTDKREVVGWWIWLLILVMFPLVILTIFGYMGKFTGTVVERAVFENSFQYSESRKSEALLYEAQLAEVNRMLSSLDLTIDSRRNLERQASGLRIQLTVARGKQR